MSSIRAQTGPSGSRIVTEDGAETPDEPYGRSKLEAENAVRESGVPFTILRPVPVYGAGAKGSLATMLALARSPLPLPLGSLSARRSILGVDNLAAAITFCIANATSLNETYIVADPEPFTLPQMIAAIRAGLNRRPGLFPAPHSVLKAALWAIRRAALWEKLEGSLVAEAGKLRRAGWNCPVSTEDGLKAVGRARRGT
jgi:UDP-glucose 4-epimerase